MTKQNSVQLFLTLIGLFFCQNAAAQISLGIRGGLLITTIDKSPLDQAEPAPDNIAGFQVAIPVEIAFGEIFAIQPEIMIGSHGAVQKSSTTSTVLGITTTSTLNIRYRVNSLEIPLLAKLKFGSETFKIHVLAGPSFGLGLNGKFNDDRTLLSTLADGTVLIDQTSNVELDAKFLKDGYQTSELGSDEFAVTPININVHFGAGLGVNLGGPNLFLDARYMLGLTDFRPEAEGDTRPFEYKSRRIGVSVGILFPL